LEKPRSNRREKSGRDGAPVRGEAFPLLRSFGVVRVGHLRAAACEGKLKDRTHRLNAGQCPHFKFELVDEAAYILIFRIAVAWNRYAEREDILRIVTGLDALQRNEAADQQSRADQEHERQSKLAYDENPARTVPTPVA